MFKLFISFFLVLLAFSAVSAFTKDDAISCFGNCIKNTESDKEDVKNCAKMCVGDALGKTMNRISKESLKNSDDASKAFLECESKCVDSFFNVGSDNSKNLDIVGCNSECANAFRGA
ncbi:hypothetical protein B9Z55_016875 [Caenorhabditis nigoni]|uniref:Chondroitin proteoglycan 4 domain-containing protein n=1 Tax=Caenorhabditis nigoni TaxID=1611254 RepID=A0A2G5T783_9PELO|nr:hypothetical protein B9Z55_016875 [Caenorhabditis nigoni]